MELQRMEMQRMEMQRMEMQRMEMQRMEMQRMESDRGYGTQIHRDVFIALWRSHGLTNVGGIEAKKAA